MNWQDSILMFVNQNDFVRAIVVVAIILIMLRASMIPQSIIQSVLIAIFGVFGIWVLMNIDYVFYILIH